MPERNAVVLAGVLVLAALAGCTRTLWTKPGVTEQEFRVDSYACERDMRQSGYYGSGIVGSLNATGFYERCMESKGYRKTREDSAEAPVTRARAPSPPSLPLRD